MADPAEILEVEPRAMAIAHNPQLKTGQVRHER